MKNIVIFIIAFFIVYILIPILMKLSVKYNFTDKPTKRKNHRNEIPLCGGVAMYMSFFLIYLFIDVENMTKKISVFIGGTLILLIGLIDDYYKANAKEFPIYPRLVIQLVAALIIFNSGITFKGFTDSFGVYRELNVSLQFILTITWIFGVTTVINWCDGMDGLAGSLSLISSLTFAGAALILNQENSVVVSIIVVGITSAFLIYNRYPARVFMGDSGANFLGFILSVIALDGAFKQATIMSLFLPILALAVPIFDNLFVVLKRFLERKPVYQADRSQIHFRLQEKGFSPRQVIIYINIISVIFSVISIILLFIKN